MYTSEIPYNTATEEPPLNVHKQAAGKLLFISRHMIVAGYYGFTWDVLVSVNQSVYRMSVFMSIVSFPDDNSSKCQWCTYQWIFTKLVMCRSGLGFLIGKIHSFLTELSTCHTSVLLFLDNKLSKN